MIKQKLFQKEIDEKEYNKKIKIYNRVNEELDAEIANRMPYPIPSYETTKSFIKRINEFILKPNIKVMSVNYDDKLNECIVVYNADVYETE